MAADVKNPPYDGKRTHIHGDHRLYDSRLDGTDLVALSACLFFGGC